MIEIILLLLLGFISLGVKRFKSKGTLFEGYRRIYFTESKYVEFVFGFRNCGLGVAWYLDLTRMIDIHLIFVTIIFVI